MFGDIDEDAPEITHRCVCNNQYACSCQCHIRQEQQEDMADFIALNGQADNEALTDWDDCSNG